MTQHVASHTQHARHHVISNPKGMTFDQKSKYNSGTRNVSAMIRGKRA